MQHFSLKWQTAFLVWPAAEVGSGSARRMWPKPKDVPWMDLCVADRSLAAPAAAAVEHG